tara:strand:- start:48 stop:338 length:291 start_codon:yes stop_codon:yes gene_type:complete
MAEPSSYKEWKYVDIGYGVNASREAHDMYMTVKRLGLEEWLINYKGGGTDIGNMDKISDGLENNNHSGFSFSATAKFIRQVLIDKWDPKYKILQPE